LQEQIFRQKPFILVYLDPALRTGLWIFDPYRVGQASVKFTEGASVRQRGLRITKRYPPQADARAGFVAAQQKTKAQVFQSIKLIFKHYITFIMIGKHKACGFTDYLTHKNIFLC
jgi:hypothetical protein